jgi:hypothetical protein
MRRPREIDYRLQNTYFVSTISSKLEAAQTRLA